MPVPPIHLRSVGAQRAKMSNLRGRESSNGINTPGYVQASRGYTMRTMEKTDSKMLYQTQNFQSNSRRDSARLSYLPDNISNNDDFPIHSETVEMQKQKAPKAFKELDKIEEMYYHYEIQFQEFAGTRFLSPEQKLGNLREGRSYSIISYRTGFSQSNLNLPSNV